MPSATCTGLNFREGIASFCLTISSGRLVLRNPSGRSQGKQLLAGIWASRKTERGESEVDPAVATPDRDLETTTNLGTTHDLQETVMTIENTQRDLAPDLHDPVAMMTITRGLAADVVAAVIGTASLLEAIQTITSEGTAAKVGALPIAVGDPHRESMSAIGMEVGDALLSNFTQ